MLELPANMAFLVTYSRRELKDREELDILSFDDVSQIQGQVKNGVFKRFHLENDKSVNFIKMSLIDDIQGYKVPRTTSRSSAQSNARPSGAQYLNESQMTHQVPNSESSSVLLEYRAV